jgi:hypothetical protein
MDDTLVHGKKDCTEWLVTWLDHKQNDYNDFIWLGIGVNGL